MKINFLKKLGLAFAAFFCCVIVFLSMAWFAFPLPGKVPILMYHFIVPSNNDEAIGNVLSESTFQKQMSFLKRFGYRVITLDDYAAIRKGQRKPLGREVVLTFDDGSTSVDRLAVPILTKLNFPLTMFLISENLKTGNYGSITTKDALRLAQNPLVRFGAHSRTHPFLSQLNEDQVENEIGGSKSELGSMLHLPIHFFAYPYGDFDERCMAISEKAGYQLSFTTSPKKLKMLQSGDYSIPRVKITESDSNLIVFWVKISGIYEAFKMWRHHLYQKNELRVATR